MQFTALKLQKFLMNNLEVKLNESLKNYCTFKIGGNAKYLFIIYSNNELIKVCKLCKLHNIKYKIIGLGANLLFDDLLFSLECVLAQAADGANPILCYLFPRGAGRNAVIGIAYRGIVFVATGTNVFHSDNLVFKN